MRSGGVVSAGHEFDPRLLEFCFCFCVPHHKKKDGLWPARLKFWSLFQVGSSNHGTSPQGDWSSGMSRPVEEPVFLLLLLVSVTLPVLTCPTLLGMWGHLC